jgi:hypothetical protein
MVGSIVCWYCMQSPGTCLIDVSPVSVEDQFSVSDVNIGIAIAFVKCNAFVYLLYSVLLMSNVCSN